MGAAGLLCALAAAANGGRDGSARSGIGNAAPDTVKNNWGFLEWQTGITAFEDRSILHVHRAALTPFCGRRFGSRGIQGFSPAGWEDAASEGPLSAAESGCSGAGACGAARRIRVKR